MTFDFITFLDKVHHKTWQMRYEIQLRWHFENMCGPLKQDLKHLEKQKS